MRRTTQTALTALAALALAVAPPALAKKGKSGEGTAVTVRVVDDADRPIPTAVIRHPEESDRHRVNSVDGTWGEQRLYLPDGSELIFEPGLILQLEVSAPNFQPQVVQYQVRRRNNYFDVVLKEVEAIDSDLSAPAIGFGRDTPREDLGTAPAAN